MRTPTATDAASSTFTVVPATTSHLLAQGRDLVVAVSTITGFPDPSRWPSRELRALTRARQAAAESVWVARGPSGECIGHALLTVAGAAVSRVARVDHDLERNAPVLELGGLAVAPDWHGQGVATALRDARVDRALALYPTATLVTLARPGGTSDQWYARHWQFAGTATGTLEPVVNVYRYPAT